MSDAQPAVKTAKVAKSLADEIASTKEKLRKLEEKQRETNRRERERNTKAVLDILKDEKLDQVSVQAWQKALPQIRKILLPAGADVTGAG